MHLIDNFISFEDQKKIEILLTSPSFPWYFIPSNVSMEYKNIMGENYNSDNFYANNPLFSHAFFSNEQITTDETSFNIIKPLLELVENKFNYANNDIKKLYRIKANLLLPSIHDCKNKYNLPHTDFDDKCNTALYYVNNSDGDTIIFKENLNTFKDVFNKDITISPKRGRMVFFDSSTYHTSSCPINSKYRIVLNIVYKN